MSFFKMLSDDPADYDHEESLLEECTSFDLGYSDTEDCIELILDTGEQFTVPIAWVVEQCRKFGSEGYRSTIH